MKRTILYSLIAAGAACGISLGQVYTTPVGYESIDLPSGIEYHLVGLRLMQPVIASGDFEVVAGSVLTDEDIVFDVVAGRTYILEVTASAAPSLVGVLQEIHSTSISGSTITTPQDLQSLGLSVGDSYTLRLAPTLEEVFAGPVVLNGFTSGQADNVWLPNGAGGYDIYFRSALVGNPWRNAADNSLAPNVPIVYADGILIQKRTASPTSSLIVSGEVKTTETSSVLVAGTVGSPSFNILSTVYPVGSTLQNSGIKASLQTGFTIGQADNVWVPNGSGGYDKYYVSSLVGNPWRDSSNANVVTDIPLPPGVIIERKSSATNIRFTPPASYSGL